jgi:hypothetical protein
VDSAVENAKIGQPPQADPVTREAYSRELISFGFRLGDDAPSEPAFYSYAAPKRQLCRDPRTDLGQERLHPLIGAGEPQIAGRCLPVGVERASVCSRALQPRPQIQ